MSTNPRRRSTLWSHRSLIWSFAQRDLKSRFKGTALGWAWSLVVPLATIVIYSLVFAVIFRAAPPPFGSGSPGSFPIWLWTGLIPWTFFLVTINVAIPTLLANGPLLQKVYFPSYTPVLGAALAILTQTLIELGIFAVILVVLGNVGPTWLLFPIWLVLFGAFVSSIALTLSILNVYYRDLAHLTNVALQLLFYLTPIIYPLSLVPENWHGLPLRTIVQLNPIAEFVASLRSIAYDLQVPGPKTWLAMLLWTFVALALAMLVYRHRGLDIGESV